MVPRAPLAYTASSEPGSVGTWPTGVRMSTGERTDWEKYHRAEGLTRSNGQLTVTGTGDIAPAGREVRTSLVPDKFGGNMDTPEMRAGTTCYLGVNVEGALFSVGDGHYRQGEGESCGTAVEGAMDVTLIVPVAMEEKLRFAIREGGRTVGAGVVAKIIE